MSTSPVKDNAPCPCGSGKTYGSCCAALHRGEMQASSAEILMRSRYSAFALGHADYLQATWASATRPADLDLAEHAVTWIWLEIRNTREGGPDDDEGWVEFIARGIAGEHLSTLHETSHFIREDGRWRYLEGKLAPDAPAKIGRNAPCPCGSGKKFKRCHGA